MCYAYVGIYADIMCAARRLESIYMDDSPSAARANRVCVTHSETCNDAYKLDYFTHKESICN